MHRALLLAKRAPLAYAIEHKQYDAIELLLSRGAKPLLLHLKPRDIDVRVLKLLLRYGCDISEKYHYSTTLIHMIRFSNVEAVRLILEHGADPSEPDNNGIPPIIHVLQKNINTIEKIDALCQYGADLTIKHAKKPLVWWVLGNSLSYDCLIPLLKWGMPCTWDDISQHAHDSFTENELKIIDGYIRANNR